MATLFELCSLIRSKNAGPFVLTFDLMASSRDNYERIKRRQPITKKLLAGIYHLDEKNITLVYHDHALAIKISIPRPIFQGELDDGDCYGGQQYVPLLDLPVD
jgi:hypothetical protein